MKLSKNKFMMNFSKAGFIFCAKLQLCLCHSFLIEMCEICFLILDYFSRQL